MISEQYADFRTDSSRRAVEAADNVVHAYDMNMGVPETPLSPLDKDATNLNVFLCDRRPDILVSGQNMPISQYRGTKRRRDGTQWTSGNAPKIQARVARPARRRIRHSFSEEPPAPSCLSGILARSATRIDSMDGLSSPKIMQTYSDSDSSRSPHFASEYSIVPGLRHTNVKEVIQNTITEALKVGGRPDSAIAQETDLGEIIEVRTRGSNGHANTKMIEWILSPEVPGTILIDQRDLAKMISCVVLNAIKFTDNGNITLRASLSAHGRYVVINVKDSGSGIPAAFLPNLFKPFSREDDSTTRLSEGLGLGLLVAKGLARKLGGDLICLRSHVSGPEKGSEFEMRVPLVPGDVCSRPASPFGSPTPSERSRISVDVDVPPVYGAQYITTPPLLSDPLNDDQLIAIRDSPPSSSGTITPAPSLQHLSLPLSLEITSSAPTRAVSKGRTIADSGAFDRNLARKYPLNFLVVEDNKINRKLLISMLQKLGYSEISEAYDGNNAVEQMQRERPGKPIDVILMDLWMPLLDGFQATEKILKMEWATTPTILAVSADITGGALERAAKVGMKGFLTKPFQIRDLEKLIVEYCASRTVVTKEEETTS
jgi:CheY-like chemotaxis protein